MSDLKDKLMRQASIGHALVAFEELGYGLKIRKVAGKKDYYVQVYVMLPDGKRAKVYGHSYYKEEARRNHALWERGPDLAALLERALATVKELKQ
jgi:hypothetical protein